MSDFNYYAFLKFKKMKYVLNDLTDDLKARVSVFFDMPQMSYRLNQEKRRKKNFRLKNC